VREASPSYPGLAFLGKTGGLNPPLWAPTIGKSGGSVRHRKNAELVIRGTLSLYGEVLTRLARRRGRWEVLGRPDLIEVLPLRGARAREALEGLAALTRGKE